MRLLPLIILLCSQGAFGQVGEAIRIETAEKRCNQQEILAGINAISSNLANVNTTKTLKGGHYQKLFPFYDREGNLQIASLSGFFSRYEPGHPHADKYGFVKYPAIDVMEEMMMMIAWVTTYDKCFYEAKNAAWGGAFKSRNILEPR